MEVFLRTAIMWKYKNIKEDEKDIWDGVSVMKVESISLRTPFLFSISYTLVRET